MVCVVLCVLLCVMRDATRDACVVVYCAVMRAVVLLSFCAFL